MEGLGGGRREGQGGYFKTGYLQEGLEAQERSVVLHWLEGR